MLATSNAGSASSNGCACAAVAQPGSYAFNDWHAMMAFVGSGRVKAQEAILESVREAAQGENDTAAFAREVGLGVALAIHAFGQGRYTDTVQLLRPIRHQSHRFGGSHAQRDLIDLTLIEAAIRSANQTLAAALAAALAAERAARRPESPLARLFVKRASGIHFSNNPELQHTNEIALVL